MNHILLAKVFLLYTESRLVEELGHNKTKRTAESEGEMPTAGRRDKMDRDGRIRDAGTNEV